MTYEYTMDSGEECNLVVDDMGSINLYKDSEYLMTLSVSDCYEISDALQEVGILAAKKLYQEEKDGD